ncbi:NYN domain-containing protein [Rheinheimera sp. WS51]|uniref:NYN domain-containing protein n=1 Tax=Rheinheimera sp. WS51 TaxID=3425886 RepID=UPI003D8A4981
MTKIAVLVDVQNVYYTTRDAYGKRFDYNAFWQRLNQSGTVIQATAYAVDRGDEKQRQFQNILRAIGFEIKLKPFIQRADGSAKGDWDVGITIDALDYAEQADIIVLVSGDGDFDLLAKKIQQKGKAVYVYGVPGLTALSLMNAATEFIPIEQNLLLQ